jgi:hypothetical protein
MTASHTREHLSTGVHWCHLKIALQGPLCSTSMAGPIASTDMDDVQQSLLAEPVRMDLLCCAYYLTLF